MIPPWMHLLNTWDADVLDLCCRIKTTVCTKEVSRKLCFVMRLLADCTGQYVKWWMTVFGEEMRSNQIAEVGKQLFKVLDSGLQLINQREEDSPAIVSILLSCRAQLSEIIDDARIYSQMINRVILSVLKSTPDEQKQLRVEKLMLKVELDCNSMQCQLDKDMHENTLMSYSPEIFSFLEMLKARKPNIKDTDLSTKKELGRGAFGIVQTAKWHKLPVAVKTFFADAYLEDELAIYEKLLHAGSSHIVQMLGYTRNKGLVLELMDEDLKTFIVRTGPSFPLIQKIDLMLQIAKAMSYLHSIDVVHRDLRPANVLVKARNDKNLLIKLTDFGISKVNFQTAMANTNMMGATCYMAPEMKADTQMYSRKVDVYSYGLMCADIVRGKVPKPGLTNQPEQETLTLPTDTPKKLEDLICSCLEYYDKKRPSFEDICVKLWLIKEEALTRVVDTIQLKLTINGLGGIGIEDNATSNAPAIHPVARNDIANIVPPVASTLTGKRAIYHLPKDVIVSGQYSVRDIPVDKLVDIRLDGFLYVTPSGQVKIADPWSTIQNPFEGGGVDPQNLWGENHLPENLGIFGQFKKLLKDQGKNFNLSLRIAYSEDSTIMFSSPERRTTFVNSVVELSREYPIFNGLHLDLRDLTDKGVDNLVLTLEALRRELPIDSFILSLICSSSAGEQWPIERAIHLVDQIHLMAVYSSPTIPNNITCHASALYGSSPTLYYIDEGVKMYISRGVPSTKIFIMGLLMAVRFSDTDGMGKPAYDMSLYGPYYNELPQDGFEEKWDDKAKAAYAHDTIQRMVYSYDNVQSMIEKANYIKENDLGGIVVIPVWADFPYDHDCSVIKALHDHLTHG